MVIFTIIFGKLVKVGSDGSKCREPMINKNTMVFSIGLNGFDRIYGRCVRSQKAYCRKFGYKFTLISRSPGELSPSESSWLKIPLISAALECGYEWVVFLDADCEVRPHTPEISSIGVEGNDIYLAKGFSGRPNAGVIVTRNTVFSKEFFARILENIDMPIPPIDDAPYENGHIIHFCKKTHAVGFIDGSWNNNRHFDPESFIQHYSNGILRKSYSPALLDWPAVFCKKLSRKLQSMIKSANAANQINQGKPLRQRLESLTRFFILWYPEFDVNAKSRVPN